MKFDHKIFTDPQERDEVAIKKAGFAKVMESLLVFYRGWERRSYLDHEVLLYAGMAVARAGHEGVDEHTYRWYERTPSIKRREVAASFLWGYWGVIKRLDVPSLTDMLGTLDDFSKDSFAYGASLLALHAAISSEKTNLPEETAQKTKETLLSHLDHLENIKMHAGVVALLEYLRE